MEFSGISKEYRAMLRSAVGDEDADKRPLKKRKKGKKIKQKEDEHTELSSSANESQEPSSVPKDVVILDSTDEELTPMKSNQDLESIETNQREGGSSVTQKVCKEYGFGDDDDDDDDLEDFDDFEDVDLDNIQVKASSNLTEDVVVSYNKKDQEEPKKRKKMSNICDKQERQFRKDYHRSHIAIMMLHGFVRNEWCNNEAIQAKLRKLVTTAIYDQLHPVSSSGIPQVKTRKFLDGLKEIMGKWIRYYKITSNKGIHKHDWYDWYNIERSNVNFERFQRCLLKGRGSRDIGAQGFVALLRAADVQARLVYSLQPPDFTSLQIKERKKHSVKKEEIIYCLKDRVLALRKGKIATSNTAHRPTQGEVELSYPVFWAEAWDSSSKTWITIDPIMFKIIENVKLKSKLEPPLSCPNNTLTYVIGYDKKNGVRDITKRYAEKYYSKTRKKRITKEENEEIWYNDFLEHLSQRPRNRADDFEDEYFLKKAEQEGMPDNIQDFKNHPFYVLEMHLRSNEVLHPKESCGTIRIKGKNEAIPVYKVSNVQQLRSPRGWFQRGRVLKAGAQPLKTKKKTPFQMRGDDDDTEERLYAEFQTDLYVPPPVDDGLITKNSYGNVDCYVPSMIPKGAVHINKPLVEDAAKLLGVDYAPACVGFKFAKRQATPRLEGIIVAEEFQDAIESVQQQLVEEEHEKQRIQLEVRALKGWDLLLTKLRIKNRLNKSHGKVEEESQESTDEQLEREYKEYMANDEIESDVESDTGMGGGFLPAEGVYNPDDESDDEDSGRFVRPRDGGGFLAEDDGGDGGEGSFIQINNNTGTGFVPDDIDGEGMGSGAGFLIGEASDDHESGVAFIDKDSRNSDDDEAMKANQETDGALDEYEAFFEQLEGANDTSDSDDYDSEPTNVKVTEMVEDQYGLEETSPAKHKAVDKPKLQVQSEDAPQEIMDEPAQTLPEKATVIDNEAAPTKLAKEPSFDEEMEIQVSKQLEEESVCSDAGGSMEEDYGFEYDSD